MPDGGQVRAAERERIALHLDILAERLIGSSRCHDAITALTAQVRANTLPAILTVEPGLEVREVHTARGGVARRDLNGEGWKLWFGRGGRRPVLTWERLRDDFGPLVAAPQDPVP